MSGVSRVSRLATRVLRSSENLFCREMEGMEGRRAVRNRLCCLLVFLAVVRATSHATIGAREVRTAHTGETPLTVGACALHTPAGGSRFGVLTVICASHKVF